VRPMPHHSPASACVSRVGPQEPDNSGDADAGPVDGTTQEPSKRVKVRVPGRRPCGPALAGTQGRRRESAATRQWTMVALLGGVPVQGEQPADVNALQAGGVAATARPPLAPGTPRPVGEAARHSQLDRRSHRCRAPSDAPCPAQRRLSPSSPGSSVVRQMTASSQLRPMEHPPRRSLLLPVAAVGGTWSPHLTVPTSRRILSRGRRRRPEPGWSMGSSTLRALDGAISG
jgi:hypothetical protein